MASKKIQGPQSVSGITWLMPPVDASLKKVPCGTHACKTFGCVSHTCTSFNSLTK